MRANRINKVEISGVDTSELKTLSEEKKRELLKRTKQGDKAARDELICGNLRLVLSIISRFNPKNESPNDLFQVGCIGLIKAIDTFSCEKGSRLATYTARCIENEILMLIRTNKKYKNDVSLSDPVGCDKDGNELTFMDLLYEKEDAVFSAVDKSIEREKFIEFVKNNLTEREFTVLSLRYGLKNGKSYAQREVASFLKISRSYISRIEKKAIEKLKKNAKNLQIEM